MIDADAAAGIGDGPRERPVQSAHERTMRGARILERLSSGSLLAELAEQEGLTPEWARDLVAEAVAVRGFDP